ncbi:MAG: hypothetical protein ACM3PF_00815 [Bacteroidota bacterium]
MAALAGVMAGAALAGAVPASAAPERGATTTAAEPGATPEPGAAPVARRVDWNLALHAPALPDSAHAAAREVPDYPITDASLADPHRWPEHALTGLGTCDLRVLASLGDSVQQGKALRDVATEKRTVGLSYDCPPHAGPVIGPAYTWDPSGALTVRSWGNYQGDRYVWREWHYYPTGELLGYLHQVYAKNLEGDPQSLEEYFARDGKLLGYSLARQGPAVGLTKPAVGLTKPAIGLTKTARWKGTPVSDDDFTKNRAALTGPPAEAK